MALWVNRQKISFPAIDSFNSCFVPPSLSLYIAMPLSIRVFLYLGPIYD
jgi:hypothetical protein